MFFYFQIIIIVFCAKNSQKNGKNRNKYKIIH